MSSLLSQVPEYGGALASALLWAASAQFVSAGFVKVEADNRLPFLMTGLLVSQLAGLVGLAGLLWWQEGVLSVNLSPFVWMAGLLTFPIGTGMYYVAGYAFGGRSDIAAQFAKVKPLFSLLLAVFILGDPLTSLFSPSTLFVVLGVLVFVASGIKGSITLTALCWGLATSAAWSLGEVMMGLALSDGALTDDKMLSATFTALLAGLVASLVFLVPCALHAQAADRQIHRHLLPFAVHGVLSFALGYFCFFHSIARIGLASTVTINAMWPILALLLACGVRRWRGQDCDVPALVWLAALLLLIGSLLQAYGISNR